ncbi:hypothetical protein ASG89_01435 [Paenibacillus sp. Soil766]|nr:hypothetical protein ASG89_01435 [Paenibacillus sp. Soil766]
MLRKSPQKANKRARLLPWLWALLVLIKSGVNARCVPLDVSRLTPNYWGKGYATKIGRAMLIYGIQENFPAFMGFAKSKHKASSRVMEKIGMTYFYERRR